jgi:hypothetical protein
VPTVISSPASFTSVRNAFETRGYGAVNSSLLAYRQGGGIVPSSSTFNSIGAGTSGDTLNLSQFSGFSVPDLLRFTTPYTGANAGKFQVSSRATSGSGSRPMYAYIALRSSKIIDFGGNSTTYWNTTGATAGDVGNTPSFFGVSWGPTSWGSADVLSSGYQVRISVDDVSTFNFAGTLAFGTAAAGYPSVTTNGFTPYYTLSSDVILELTTYGYATGTIEVRSIAFPSVQISTTWFLEAEGDA